MQLTVTKDKYAGHARSPWLVVLPSRISSTGKRQYKRFATRAAAQAFCAAVRTKVRTDGEQPLAVVAARVASDATAALQLLEGTGVSLLEAVRQYLAADTSSGVAFAHHLHSGGAEESERPDAAPLTIKQALAAMEEQKTHQSPTTRQHRKAIFNTLFRCNPTLADTTLATCTTTFVRSVLDATWAHSPAVWNSGRRALHALFSNAIKYNDLPMQNPVTRIDFKRIQEKEITALHPDDLRALFAACRPATDADIAAASDLPPADLQLASGSMADLRPYLAICAFAGVRPAEASRILWQDIDMEDGILSVRARHAKTGGTRHIPLHPTLRQWLIACRPAAATGSDPIAPQHRLARRLTLLRRRAGFSELNPWQKDVLRHSYATYYLKAQCGDLHQLQLNMGHRDAQLLYTRYTNMRGVNRAMADAWWQILPT